TRQIRQRKRVNVRERKGREAAATRTVAQIVAGDRSAVRGEDRSLRRHDRTAARELISSRSARSQEFAEITDAHSCSRHWYRVGIARAAENRCAVALAVEREEEERTIASVVERRRAFTGSR